MAEMCLAIKYTVIVILLLYLLKCETSATTPMTPESPTTELNSKLQSTDNEFVSSEIKRRDSYAEERRRRGRLPPMAKATNALFMENPYEPYWKGGDWVYGKEVTKRPQSYFLNTGYTAHSECNQICTTILMEYGEVCGQRLIRKTWEYEYKDFKDMCHLQLENCVSGTKRWYPIRKGRCKDVDMTTHPTAEDEIVSRVMLWALRFPEPLYDPNQFTTTTMFPYPMYTRKI